MKLYKYLKAEYALAFLRSQELKVATMYDANDPSEWLPYLQDESSGRDFLANGINKEIFKQHYGRTYGFVSFSEDATSPLLWAHYANAFRGMALEFEVLDPAKLIHVDYPPTNDKPIVTEKEIRAVDAYEENLANEATLKKFLATKGIAWSYEKEWRMLVRLDACRVAAVGVGGILKHPVKPTLRLTGVVLGCECGIQERQVLMELEKCQENAVSICRLLPDEKTYAYHIVREFGESMCANKV